MKTSSDSHETLRAWLRAGDPAADGRRLTAAEADWMRQRVLAAAESGARASGRRVLAAVAAVAALLLALSLGLWWRGGTSPPAAGPEVASVGPGAPGEGRQTAAPITPAAPVTPEAEPRAGDEAPPAAPTTAPTSPPPRLARHRAAVPAPEQTRPARSRSARQLQFSAPGGTRIIWVLNPELSLESTPTDTNTEAI